MQADKILKPEIMVFADFWSYSCKKSAHKKLLLQTEVKLLQLYK